jgi:Flp pilus assembly pilin Flp
MRKIRLSERGATAVEAALVAPLIFLVLFGIMEFSLMFRSSLGVTNAANDGARAASVAGRDLDADYRTLRQIEKSSAAIDSNDIERIVIFRASSFDVPVPPACLAVVPPGGVNGVCNVYGPDQMQWPASEFGCNPGSNPRPDPDRYWCPDDRIVSVGTGLDYVGIHIEFEHVFATGMVGDSQDVSDTAVLKIEPEAQ